MGLLLNAILVLIEIVEFGLVIAEIDALATYEDAQHVRLCEKWFAIQDGFMATFSKENTQELAFYSKSGYWQYTIMYYGEKGLPDEVRDRVKKVYYNYSIIGVEEIRTVEQNYYVVHVQDESTDKKLMVTDSEMRVVDDFTKS